MTCHNYDFYMTIMNFLSVILSNIDLSSLLFLISQLRLCMSLFVLILIYQSMIFNSVIWFLIFNFKKPMCALKSLCFSWWFPRLDCSMNIQLNLSCYVSHIKNGFQEMILKRLLCAYSLLFTLGIKYEIGMLRRAGMGLTLCVCVCVSQYFWESGRGENSLCLLGEMVRVIFLAIKHTYNV